MEVPTLTAVPGLPGTYSTLPPFTPAPSAPLLCICSLLWHLPISNSETDTALSLNKPLPRSVLHPALP